MATKMTREEAINKVRQMNLPKETMEILQALAPELAESEDERIRRWLCDYFSSIDKAWIYKDITCIDILRWLEKQKEQKPAEWSEEDEKQIRETLIQLVQDAWDGRLTDEVSDERVYDACMTYLEKRKEQKYIGLSKADKLFLQDVADVLGDNEYKDAAKRLRDLSESLYLQPKAEWSEEDEKMLKWIEDILLIADGDLNDKLNGKVSPITDSAYSSIKTCIAKCLSWLKSLRPQYHGDVTMTEAYKMSKEAGEASHWKPSEDEERLINTSISFLKDFADKGYENAVECIDWLKSKLNGNTCK